MQCIFSRITFNKSLADFYIDQYAKEWIEGKYSVGDRRVPLTKSIGQAWEEMHKEDGTMIREAFENVGLVLIDVTFLRV